ncbi:MAG: aspartate kinase [Polyangiaceae bacterium]
MRASAGPNGKAVTPKRPLVVKKFGGTSVSGVERMREVARLALEGQKKGDDVVVVVSAMSGETDRLLALGQRVLPEAAPRELDVLVSTGEQVSCALVAMAIQAHGGQACSLLGHQVPLVTDSAFSRARIQRIERDRVRAALAAGKIPVVAGFQGVDRSHNITTLGRGGSDTTAVALAAALGASACEIFTDVDGVFTADPRVAPSGKKLASVPYEEMLELASLGAKVLQVRSVEIAMKYSVPVHVRSTFSGEEGTWVTDRDRAMEARALTGVACARGQARVTLAGVPSPAGALADLTALLADLDIASDMLHQSAEDPESGRADLVVTLAASDLPRAQEALDRAAETLGARELRVTRHLAKVSLVGIGVRTDPKIAARLCRALSRAGIAPTGLSVSELRVSCLVGESDADSAVRALHDAFHLGGPAPAPMA